MNYSKIKTKNTLLVLRKHQNFKDKTWFFQVEKLLKDLTSTVFKLGYGCQEKDHYKKETS